MQSLGKFPGLLHRFDDFQNVCDVSCVVLRVFDGDAAVAWLKGHTSAQAPRAQYRLSSYGDDHSRHLLSGDVRERVCHAPCQVSKVLASRQLNDPVIHHRGFSTPDH